MQKFGKRENVCKEFLNKINNFGSIGLKELIGPNGYAQRIINHTNLKTTQLRKIYAEFKYIHNLIKSQEKEEKIKMRLYRLYPILAYQQNRGLINEDFKEIMVELINWIDSNFAKENYDKVMDFMTALVAYAKKERS